MLNYECPKCGEKRRSRLKCLVDSLRCESCDTTFVIGSNIDNYTNEITIPVERARLRIFQPPAPKCNLDIP
jgi:ribosomal protein L37AE/L43A